MPTTEPQFQGKHVAFRMTQATFSEFVRVSFVKFPAADQDTIIGSRASNRYSWHCINYHRRGNKDGLVIDTFSVSHSYPNKINVLANKDSIKIEVSPNAQTRGYTLRFNKDGQNTHWKLLVNTAPSVNDTIGVTNNALEGPWIIDVQNQVKITIRRKNPSIEAFVSTSSYVFNVFRTNDHVNGKKCKIEPGPLVFIIDPLLLNF